MKTPLLSLMTILAAATSVPAQAVLAPSGIAITEVASWSSGNSPVASDWFELTNLGVSAIDITGWSMDDSSATPGVAPLTGISSIAAGESVIFIEYHGDTTVNATFISTWFGGNAPVGLQIGHYEGSGVGLSTGGDGVNIFNAANTLQASVSFGASTTGITFDNAAGVNGQIAQLSVVGVNGAFVAVNHATEIGSPGSIAAVPEPETYALMLAGLSLVGFAARKR